MRVDMLCMGRLTNYMLFKREDYMQIYRRCDPGESFDGSCLFYFGLIRADDRPVMHLSYICIYKIPKYLILSFSNKSDGTNIII